MANASSVARQRIEQLRVSAYAVPTDAPEADGTFAWQRTVLVTVEVESASVTGLGYTYADVATAELIASTLAPAVLGRSALSVTANQQAMVQVVRNLGRAGIAAMALSAVDTALWDLKARLLGLSLVDLLGGVRDSIPIYGSGGFTSYSEARLEQQLSTWVTHGITRVKMKVGSDAHADSARVRSARKALGTQAELFVDANGAYSRKQALSLAHCFAEFGVSWFEEPVSSDDLDGLALLVERAPASIEIATGEYGYDAGYFARLIAARAADVVQVDVTRCGGISGFLQIAALCDAHGLPMSAHCAPALHVALGCALSRMRHLEYFHDHVRIENQLFAGVPQPISGALAPDRSRLGLGLELKHDEAQRFLVERKLQRWEH